VVSREVAAAIALSLSLSLCHVCCIRPEACVVCESANRSSLGPPCADGPSSEAGPKAKPRKRHNASSPA
jgi:hypothetical protein